MFVVVSIFQQFGSLSVQIPTKKIKTSTQNACAISPVLLECPEADCGKKYKHANGLKYHQSHAHGAGEDFEMMYVTCFMHLDSDNGELLIIILFDNFRFYLQEFTITRIATR